MGVDSYSMPSNAGGRQGGQGWQKSGKECREDSRVWLPAAVALVTLICTMTHSDILQPKMSLVGHLHHTLCCSSRATVELSGILGFFLDNQRKYLNRTKFKYITEDSDTLGSKFTGHDGTTLDIPKVLRTE